ncbi:MAG: cupin domain-containing protein [Solimonas sp.]
MIDLGMPDAEFRASRLEQGLLYRRAAMQVAPPAWREVDALLHAIDPRPPTLQLFQRGRMQASEAYVDEGHPSACARPSLNRKRLYERLSEGATLVFNRLECFMPLAALLCQNLAERMRNPTMANAYLSFSGIGGGEATFGAHWDTHDVFALQLIGRKRWRVYEPTLTLPLSSQTSQRSGHCRPAVPVLDCVLSPGDLLYLPRGWWHEVELIDRASFHVSVGLYPPSLHDYMQWVTARALSGLVEARKSLNPASLSDLRVAITALNGALLHPAHLAAFEREYAGRRPTPSVFDLGLLAEDVLPAGESEVHLAPGVVYRGAGGETQVDARLALDADRRGIVAVLSREGPLSIAALRGFLPARPPEALRSALMGLIFDDAVVLRRR